MTSGPDDRVIIEFLDRYWEDQVHGNVRDVSFYTALFPGHEDLVRTEYFRQVQEPETQPEAARGADREVAAPWEPRYRIVGELGEGGQAVVYRAMDESLGRAVALKVISLSGPGTTSLLSRMRREATILARLDHPGICRVLDVGHDQHQAWIAMNVVPGRDLGTWAAEARGRADGRQEILAALQGVAEALHAAHALGVVHRDIKPTNILVDDDGRPVVLDFGMALDHGATATVTVPGTVLGTPPYMAPEQLRPTSRGVDARTDVWSLGVTLFEALSGARPFTGRDLNELAMAVCSTPAPDLQRVVPEVPADLARIVARALEREPRHRYATAQALAEDLRRAATGGAVVARPASWSRRWWEWAGDRPALVAMMGVALILGGFLLKLALGGPSAAPATPSPETRLADALSLVEEEERLWPVAAETVPRMERWLARVRSLRESGSGSGTPDGATAESESELEARLRMTWQRLHSLEPAVSSRREQALMARRVSLDEEAERWTACLESQRSAADGEPAVPHLTSVEGLVPLGADSQSGLWEFWHVLSGARPQRGPNGRWIVGEETGMVFVLIPPQAEVWVGHLLSGTEAEEMRSTKRVYPNADELIGPRHQPVNLDAYFISKYEMTQAQWMRLSGGPNPSHHVRGMPSQKSPQEADALALHHPVENITRDEAVRVLGRYNLGLPTEVQWEVAARGGESGYWFRGSRPAAMELYANVLGEEIPAHLGRGALEPHFSDGVALTAPVGWFLPNRFGLHDPLGNVWEWCADPYGSYQDFPWADGTGAHSGPDPLRGVVRGGGLLDELEHCRCGVRRPRPVNSRDRDIGVRPTSLLKK